MAWNSSFFESHILAQSLRLVNCVCFGRPFYIKWQTTPETARTGMNNPHKRDGKQLICGFKHFKGERMEKSVFAMMTAARDEKKRLNIKSK